MPTGVLRDVWYALGNNSNGHRSSLEKVWVRFHDNKEVAASADTPAVSNPIAPVPVPNGALAALPSNSELANGIQDPRPSIELSYQNTECPSFSILPPLKSLTVLEIDECAYLAEMSILVQRSLSSLRELRVGMSSSYYTDSRNRATSGMSYVCHGGILGLIMSKILKEPDIRGTINSPKANSATAASGTAVQGLSQGSALPLMISASGEDPLIVPASIKLPDSPEDRGYKDTAASSTTLETDRNARAPNILSHVACAPHLTPNAPESKPLADPQKRSLSDELPQPHNASSNSVIPKLPEVTVQHRLRLEVLELEKVHFSVPVLHNSIDWSILTSITLLQGGGHEELWKFLRRTYSPKSNPSSILSPKSSSGLSQQVQLRSKGTSNFDYMSTPEYRLNLRRIHTDHVSSALILFLKETLAPNSLEWLILQDRGKTASTVTIESIYRGPLRCHRSSLKKVSIDSSSSLNSGTRSNRWKRWQLSREILTFITSGKMNSIRELGMAIDHKDWVSNNHMPMTAPANKFIALLSTETTQHTTSPLTLPTAHRYVFEPVIAAAILLPTSHNGSLVICPRNMSSLPQE